VGYSSERQAGATPDTRRIQCRAWTSRADDCAINTSPGRVSSGPRTWCDGWERSRLRTSRRQKWAVAQRTAGADDAALDRAFNDGAMLRTHVLRPTWHFVSPADIRWMLALSAPPRAAGKWGWYRNCKRLGENPAGEAQPAKLPPPPTTERDQALNLILPEEARTNPRLRAVKEEAPCGTVSASPAPSGLLES
jgi:hypothetical protein